MIAHSRPTIGRDELDAVARILSSGHLAQGAEVEAFERECAEACGRQFGVAVSSGTAALHLALGALGVAPGERVGAPSYACAALVTAIKLQGAEPCLCDIGEDYNLDAATLPPELSAVIVPHLFGAPAALPEGTVIEDIAQSIGGPTGRAGVIAVTSFYATKLLTTGEGGMLLTDDEGVAEYARDRRDYDNRDDGVQRYPYKMTNFQAAMGRVQLRRLPEFIRRRGEIAAAYAEGFRPTPLRLPAAPGHVFFRYVVETDRRDELQRHLAAAGIEAKRPVHRPAHHFLGGHFPRSQYAHDHCLSLPIYPTLIDDDVRRVIESVRRFIECR